jgi:hypothetical protein
MLRKTVVAMLSVAAVSLLTPTLASAGSLAGHRLSHGGPGLAFGPHGLGLYAFYPYGAYGYHFGYYNYPYHYEYADYRDDNGGCYLRRHVHTRHGWRLRPVEVCD